jgi:hypothetical protein
LDAIGRDYLNDIISDKRLIADMEDIRNMGLCKGIISKILDKPPCNRNILQKIEDNAVTFVISVRINFPERKRNLYLLLESLRQIPNSSVIILEADKEPHFECPTDDFISYYFVEDSDRIFHRTKYRNMLLSMAKTRIVGVWDTDVIIRDSQIIKSISQIQKGSLMSSPYDGQVYTLSADVSEQYHKNRSISFLMENADTFPQTFGTYIVGGAFMVNKDEYIKAGGENEKFYGWGIEDLERVKRMEILGFPVSRVEGPLFHLYHPRTSWFDNEDTEIRNRSEFIKVCSMTKQELSNYIETWKNTPFFSAY